MRKNILMLFVRIVLLMFFVEGVTAVDIPWSTTYDCDEWEHTGAGGPNCDTNFYIASDSRTGTKITTAANYPGGGGVRGMRQYLGDGTNQQTSGLGVSFSNQPEIWIRWYMRYEEDFAWTGNWPGYDKWLYIDSGQSDCVVPEWDGNEVNVYSCVSGNNKDSTANWQSIMGGTTGDGEWHYYEIYVKQDGSNGASKMWIDGTFYLDWTNTNYGSSSFSSLVVGSNCNSPNNGEPPGYVDFDDIAISNTGYIGPITVGDIILPQVSVTSPTQGQIVSGTITVSADASDNVGVAGVQFKLNGANLGAEDTTASYSIFWDTTTVSDGSYTLTATARDAVGNSADSSPISIIVNNSGYTLYHCDIAWYRGEGIASDGWRDNIQSVFEDLEASEGICWEIIGSAQDIIDGILQNPDGSPRYNLIYFMGGSGRNYNAALGVEGAQKIRDFVNNGGNYVGTCAGAFYGSTNYVGIFPGAMNFVNVIIDVDYILANHPINDGFGSQLSNVRYYGGGWLEEDVANVDYVATYSTSNSNLDGHPAVVSNTYGDGRGRVVLSGAHPEAKSSTLLYFKRLITYALENSGEPQSQCCPADNNPEDGVVSITELMNYIGDWKLGSVTIEQLMTGIGEWKNGCS